MKNVLITICLLAGMVLVQGCKENKSAPKLRKPAPAIDFVPAVVDVQGPRAYEDHIQKETTPGIFDGSAVENILSRPQTQIKQWTSADSYDLQCLEEEILALQRIIANQEGKWNAEMIRQCQIELHQKEATLSALLKKYQ